MRIIIALLLSLSVSSWAATAVTGNKLMEWVPSFERVASDSANNNLDYTQAGKLTGYIAGARDSLEKQRLVCVPAQVKEDQVTMIVIEYLEGHSEEWGEPGFVVVFDSLKKLYGCN
jgi:hypothetical protein